MKRLTFAILTLFVAAFAYGALQAAPGAKSTAGKSCGPTVKTSCPRMGAKASGAAVKPAACPHKDACCCQKDAKNCAECKSAKDCVCKDCPMHGKAAAGTVKSPVSHNQHGMMSGAGSTGGCCPHKADIKSTAKAITVKAGRIASVDPVCKMKMNTRAVPAGGKSVYQGTTYLFCSKSCKALFDKNPVKYIK